MIMETRKIQRTGHSTFTVSLPKDWVLGGGLNKGERMVMNLRQDGSIMLTVPGKARVPKEYHLVGAMEKDALLRRILGAYLAGYQSMTLRFPSEEGNALKTDLRKVLSLITGLEVMEENSVEVRIKDLFDSAKYTPAKAIERMHNLTRFMVCSSISALGTRDEGLLSDLEDRDRNVDWLNWLVTRQCNLVLYDVSNSDALGIEPGQALGYVLVSRSLERIADHAIRVARNIPGVPPEDPIVQDALGKQDMIVQLLDGALCAFKDADREGARSVIYSCRGFRWISVPTGVADTTEVISAAYIADSMNRIITYIDEIAEIAYNSTFSVSACRPI